MNMYFHYRDWLSQDLLAFILIPWQITCPEQTEGLCPGRSDALEEVKGYAVPGKTLTQCRDLTLDMGTRGRLRDQRREIPSCEPRPMAHLI